ncbi:hypothetical protein [Streptomyces bambusae]|uniref:hypothetical protein n=1 Tax=Streptomyces bambusae TaxID=1550616 RepID=UPI002155708C|nr:hypothetical protein [Streptomyces bambusae]
MADVEATLRPLADRFAKAVRVPGNHELWTPHDAPVRLRDEARSRHLVDLCRRLGVVTPEDPVPVWAGPAGRWSWPRSSSSTTTPSGPTAPATGARRWTGPAASAS